MKSETIIGIGILTGSVSFVYIRLMQMTLAAIKNTYDSGIMTNGTEWVGAGIGLLTIITLFLYNHIKAKNLLKGANK